MLVDEHRGQRLHALDGVPVGDLLEDLARAAGCRSPSSLARARTSSVSSSSRHGGAQSRGDRLEGALVGDRERPDLLDLVAPELHPQRVLLGGREDVDDAAADRELAALLHEVDPGVRRAGEPSHDVVELDLVTDRELDRLQVGEPADLRLEHRADRGHDHLERAVGRRRCRGAGAGAARRAGVRRCRCAGTAARAAASPRRGSRRPATGPSGHPSAVDQVLGLARRRGDGQHGAAGVDEALDHERAQRARARSGRARGRARRGRPRIAAARVSSERTRSARALTPTGLLLHSRQHERPPHTPGRGFEGVAGPVYEVPTTPRSASLRSTQNSLPSGSASTTQPVPSPRTSRWSSSCGRADAERGGRPPRPGCRRRVAGRSAAGS